jgi:hypothetical protein
MIDLSNILMEILTAITSIFLSIITALYLGGKFIFTAKKVRILSFEDYKKRKKGG